MRKNKIKTTKEEIVDYWFSRVDECRMSVDASEAHERCWRCGYKYTLERCHIIADSLGGEDKPSNFVLLCNRCHVENPNVLDPEIMWDWIYAYKTPFYDTFWFLQGAKEYKKIYNKSISEEIIERNINDEKIIKNILEEEIRKTTFHFGHPYLNSATIAGILRMTFKRYDSEQCV
ncbi:HNH endonuclease [Clostridium botulinum]|nr:HNH endonuclease [Clostridium botulinum]